MSTTRATAQSPTHAILGWHPHHLELLENEPGLTAARVRGINESEGELLVFVDDDNLLADDYLERAVEIARRIRCWACSDRERLNRSSRYSLDRMSSRCARCWE